MGKRIGALALLALGALGQAPAEATCTCRGRNVVAQEGQTVCLSTPWGARLARCEKAQNVTTWRFLDGPCPLVESRPRAGLMPRG